MKTKSGIIITPQKYELVTNANRGLVVVCVLFVIWALIASIKLIDYKTEARVIKDHVGTYYSGDQFYVHFNLTKSNRLALVEQLEAVCKNLQMEDCMNAKDIIINNKGGSP